MSHQNNTDPGTGIPWPLELPHAWVQTAQRSRGTMVSKDFILGHHDEHTATYWHPHFTTSLTLGRHFPDWSIFLDEWSPWNSGTPCHAAYTYVGFPVGGYLDPELDAELSPHASQELTAKAPTKCTCEFYALLREGCKCGQIERDRAEKASQR